MATHTIDFNYRYPPGHRPNSNAFNPVRPASAGSRSPPRRPRPVLQRRLGSPGPRPPGQHRGPPRRLTPVRRMRGGPGDEAGGASPRRRAGGWARVRRAEGVRIGALNPPLLPYIPSRVCPRLTDTQSCSCRLSPLFSDPVFGALHLKHRGLDNFVGQ